MSCKLLLMITKLLVDKAHKEDLMTGDQDNAGYMILQPGKKLDISALIKAKRFVETVFKLDLLIIMYLCIFSLGA